MGQGGERSYALQVEGVSKRFCRDLKRSFMLGALDILNELGGREPSLYLRGGEFWALKDISFEVEPGQGLGLIGANGSGKTTLLKILSGIIKPTSGKVRARGRIAPLIALGAGFNPILTGRENIFINLSLLGLSTREITQKFDSVLDFAEVWEAIDAPLRTYSSGMAARLGFSCAIHTDPDILFVDEVLAVGDARFRTKCYQKLAQMRERGTALILVTHSPNAILSACQNSLYLKKGQLVFHGPTDEALQLYQQDQDELDKKRIGESLAERKQLTANQLRIVSVHFEDEEGNLSDKVRTGKKTSLVVRLEGPSPASRLALSVIIREQSLEMTDVLSLSSARDGVFFDFGGGHGVIKMQMPYCGMKAGRYIAKLMLTAGDTYNVMDLIESYKFEGLADNSMGPSGYYQPRSWSFKSLPL